MGAALVDSRGGFVDSRSSCEQTPSRWDMRLVDRSEHIRRDPKSLEAVTQDARARVIPVWRNQALINGGRPPTPASVPLTDALRQETDSLIFLGLAEAPADSNGGDISPFPLFTLDVSAFDEPLTLFTNVDLKESATDNEAPTFKDLRIAGLRMDPRDAQLCGFARTMCRWHRKDRFCALCGSTLRTAEAGYARICTGCGHKHFPRTDTAMMVLVTYGDECLLARQASWPKGMYSALAGFVEPGESLEECVHRETFEEVGLRLASLRYVGSQPWPFPNQLMVGFVAEAVSKDVVLDREELEEARWVHRDSLQKGAKRDFSYPPPLSLSHALIRGFADGRDGPLAT